jgi:glyoxylase-like metal-dependent hydrolase (beta-lactamase superfamily II)
VPTFPNARYLFVRPEFDHWKATPDMMGDDVFGDSVAPIVDAGLADLVGLGHRVCDSVWFEPTTGHTPGHVSVVVSSGGAKAIITGDMTHSPIQIADPELSSAFDTDQEAARVTRREAFARWADGSTLVIGTHFGAPCAGTLHPDGEGRYRLQV